MSAEDIVRGYCDDILHGKIASGRYIRLAVERFLDDIDGVDYYVDWKEVENIYNLGKCLHHYEGKYAGMPFQLEGWQLFIASNIFAVKVRGTNIRKYRTSLTKCSKKQGKTFMTVLFLLYASLSEPNSGQNFFTANSRTQASIAFNQLTHLCNQLDPKHKDFKILRSEIRIKPNDGLIRVMSSDSSKADGINCSFGLVDEFEEATSNAMFENLLSSTASRDNSHIAVISTAGFDLQSADYTMMQQCKRILDGDIVDDTVFSALYIMDDDDDWEDESNWIKCNPNIGKSVSYEFLRKRAQTAKTSASQYTAILTKNFNVYLDSPTVFIQRHVLDKQSFHFDYEDFKKNRSKYTVWGGIDLSSVCDLSALSLLFVNESDRKYYFYSKCYLPESALIESPNAQMYKDWRRRGYITITPGNVIDYDYILKDLVEFYRDFQVQWFGYDRYGATQFVINATEAGLPMEEYAQNLLNFTRPTREIERLLRNGSAFIDDNPATYFCFNNIVLKEDYNGNVKPVKNEAERTHKIDIVIAMIEALGVYLKYNSWD